MSEQGEVLKDGSSLLSKTSFFRIILISIALTLGGGGLIYFIAQGLTFKRDHRDLVMEIRSMTFGNRWISAYELSKYLLNNRIPEKERPWVREQLIDIYNQAKKREGDFKLQKFSLVALGTFGANDGDKIIPVVKDAIFSKHPELIFQGLYILGNMTKGISFPWKKLLKTIDEFEDYALLQLGIFTFSWHKVPGRRASFLKFLRHQKMAVRYGAAIGLIDFQELEALPHLREIIKWKVAKNELSPAEKNLRQNWQINLLRAYKRSPWRLLKGEVSELSKLRIKYE